MRVGATEQEAAPKGSELDSLLRQYEQIWHHMEQEEAAKRSTEQDDETDATTIDVSLSEAFESLDIE